MLVSFPGEDLVEMQVECKLSVASEVKKGFVFYAITATHIVITVDNIIIVGQAATQQDSTQKYTLFQIDETVHAWKFIDDAGAHTGSFRYFIRNAPRTVNDFF